jgi:hypothetical protein
LFMVNLNVNFPELFGLVVWLNRWSNWNHKHDFSTKRQRIEHTMGRSCLFFVLTFLSPDLLFNVEPSGLV